MQSNNYITSRLQGRTGNMMFQIAHGFAKSLEFNRQFIAPSHESSSGHLEKTLFRKIDFNITHTPSGDISKHVSLPFHYIEIEEPHMIYQQFISVGFKVRSILKNIQK